MNDTSLAVDKRYRAKLMQRTGEERLMMGCAMRDAARALVEASLREQDSHVTTERLRKGVFLRFYGHEFDTDTCVKILAAIQEAALSAEGNDHETEQISPRVGRNASPPRFGSL